MLQENFKLPKLPTEIIYYIVDRSSFTAVLNTAYTCRYFYEDRDIWNILFSKRVGRSVYINCDLVLVRSALYESLNDGEWFYKHQEVALRVIEFSDIAESMLSTLAPINNLIRKFIKKDSSYLQYIYDMVPNNFIIWLISTGYIFDEEAMKISFPDKESVIVSTNPLELSSQIAFFGYASRRLTEFRTYDDFSKLKDIDVNLANVTIEEYMFFETYFDYPKRRGLINSIKTGNVEVHNYICSDITTDNRIHIVKYYIILEDLFKCNSVEIFNEYIDLYEIDELNIYSKLRCISLEFFLNILENFDIDIDWKNINYDLLKPDLFEYLLQFYQSKDITEIVHLIRARSCKDDFKGMKLVYNHYCSLDDLDVYADNAINSIDDNPELSSMMRFLYDFATDVNRNPESRDIVTSFIKGSERTDSLGPELDGILLYYIKSYNIDAIRFMTDTMGVKPTHTHISEAFNKDSPLIFKYLVDDIIYPELFELIEGSTLYEDIVDQICI